MRKMNLYKASLTLQAISFYLLATGRTGWYLYVLLSLIFLERAFVAFALMIWARMQVESAKQLLSIIEEAQANIASGPFNQEDTHGDG